MSKVLVARLDTQDAQHFGSMLVVSTRVHGDIYAGVYKRVAAERREHFIERRLASTTIPLRIGFQT
jgi:hypothetical protein